MNQFDAVLLFCHGARAPGWREPFDLVVQDLSKRLAGDGRGASVSIAFLEFMQPDFASEVARLYAQGARRVKLMLLFLAAGGHTLRDVQALVSAATQLHPDLVFDVSGTMLDDSSMREATVRWLSSKLQGSQ